MYGEEEAMKNDKTDEVPRSLDVYHPESVTPRNSLRMQSVTQSVIDGALLIAFSGCRGRSWLLQIPMYMPTETW